MRVIQTQDRAYGVDLAGAPSACAPRAAGGRGKVAFPPRTLTPAHARIVTFLGGGSFDMVAMFEIVFLIVCALLGLWWVSRTSRFRSLRRSGRDPRQPGAHISEHKRHANVDHVDHRDTWQMRGSK
jgi:hypothetical protein